MSSRSTSALAVSALAVAALVLAAPSPSAAKPLVCPTTADATKVVSAADLASLTGNDIDRAAKLKRIVTIMSDRGMSAGSIIDNLVGAYCPAVAANTALNDQQKTMAVRTFAAQTARTVYAPDTADAIIIDVPLAPDVANAVNSKAKAARMSPEEWAAKAITNDIKTAR